MVKVLVAGAAGTVGERVALELRRRGHDVYGLIRNPEKGKELVKGEVKLVIGSITDPKSIEEVVKTVNVIVNATNDVTNPNLDSQSLDAINSVIEKVGGEKKKVIFSSGGLVYASSPKPVSETSPTSPLPMVQSRIKNEQDIINSKLFHGTVARLPMVYGGRTGHWTIYFEQAATGKVSVYGDGTNILSFAHIDDIAAGIARIVEVDTSVVSGQIFNIAEPLSGPFTLKDVALAFATGAGHPIVEVGYEPWGPWAFFDVNVWMSTEKATKLLGWTATHNLVKDAKVLYAAWKELGVKASWF